MSWFYAEGGTPKGPVSEEAFRALVQAGSITATTLVWHAGMSEWQPYGSVVPAAGATQPPSPLPGAAQPVINGPTAVCAECGQTVAAAHTLEIQGRVICANCKPRVVQRMVEGADAGRGRFELESFLAGLRARGGYRVDIGGSISRGWTLVKGNFWPCVGNTLLIYLVQGASAQVPCLGLFAQLLLTGPLLGGLYMYFLRQIRGQAANVNDAFSGMKAPMFTPLMLASLIIQVLPVLVTMVMMVPMFLSMAALEQQATPEFPAWIFVAIVPLALVMTYYALITTPTYLIIADTGVSAWEGLKLSVKLVHMRFFSFLGFVIVVWLLMLAGILALCVGVFVVAPVIMAACAYIWSDILKTSEEGRAAVGAPLRG